MGDKKRHYYLMSKVSKLRMLKHSEQMTAKEAEERNARLEQFVSKTLVWVEDEEELNRGYSLGIS